MTGQCKLCLKTGVALQNSHYIPAGVYKRLRDNNSPNPNPWMVTRKVAVQTSQQMTAHLLCHDCEGRLSKNGEQWVLRNCLQQDGSFPLRSMLSSMTPHVSSPNEATKVYYASRIPEIDVPAIAYFGASIFWRGSIYPWNDDGTVPIELGKFGEEFRKYLMGEQDFPKYACLLVVVREDKGIDRLTFSPVSERIGMMHAHKFPMPGLAFTLSVSKNLPYRFYNSCFVHGQGNPIALTPRLEEYLLQIAARAVQKNK